MTRDGWSTMAAAETARSDKTVLPAYVIHGRDGFLRRKEIDWVIDRVIGPDREGMAYVEFDGPKAELAEVLDECRTPSLLAPTRLVCVRDADEFVTAHREALERYLQSPSATGVLLLDCGRWDTRWRLHKLVNRIGRTVRCDPPKGRQQLAAWVVERGRDPYGCKLAPGAAAGLADLVGDDLGVLDTELAKLSTYVAPRTDIRLADVQELVGATRTEVVFGVTDAIGRRDAGKALALWDQVLATDRAAPHRSIGGLAYGFRRLIEAKRLVEQGLSVSEAAKRARIWTDPGDLRRQLDRFSLRQWRDHLVQLLRIDTGSKSGLGTVRCSVEKFIVELCSVAPAR